MSTRTPAERTRDEQLVEAALLGKLLPPHDQRIHTKVVGVTATNPDGSSRQDAIWKMTQFEFVDLVRNPGDRFDRNAIQVIATIPAPPSRSNHAGGTCRVQIGHIDADIAHGLAPRLDAGEPWRAIATRVGGKISRGVSLMLFREAKQTSAPKPVPLCAHVMPAGHTCGCPALRGQSYCHHHRKLHAGANVCTVGVR